MASCKRSASEAFSIAFDANMDEIQAAGRQRRQLMQEVWENIDKGWRALQQRLIDVGIVKSSEQGMLRLNVGGSHVNVSQSILIGQKPSATRTLASLFERVWDKRLPRDDDGFIVLDESPTCVKYIMHAILNASGTASGTPKLALLGGGLLDDDKAYLPYVFRALGLPEHRSAALDPDDFGPMSATILGWCPGQPSGLGLLYRASRDGWDPRAFHSRCDDITPTVTLYRVSNTGPGSSDSIVGGFNSVTWAPVDDRWRSSPKAFVFMVKDGASTESTSFKPAKWGLTERKSKRAVWCHARCGPWFGYDLGMNTNGSSPGTLKSSSNDIYDVPAENPFQALNGRDVVEIETFRVCYATTRPSTPRRKVNTPALLCPPPPPGLIDIPTFEITTMSAEGGREEDIRTFGVSIADSLMEERIALHQAHDQLADANAKAAESVNALAAVYGPDVAVGKGDTVVELSVRGTRMTTLRSTLQAFPDSALATQFDEEKWPATEKDVDKRGRRVMDWSPSVFSKVLDVLRMKKRASWTAAGVDGGGNVRVVVKAADRGEFEAFVGMYFPGCESSVMDFVAFTRKNSKEPRAGS